MNASAASELQQLLRVAPANFAGNPSSDGAVAHAALQALRDEGDERFLFLRTILELRENVHSNEELLFHCVTGLRQVVLRRWSALPKQYKDTVRDFLFVMGHEHLPRTIKLACYLTAASFWKRQWNEHDTTTLTTHPTPEEQTMVDAMTARQIVRLKSEQDLLQQLESFMQPNSPYVASGAQFLSILVGEFMGKSAVQYHLPLEFHKKAHTSFETDGWLDKSLRLSMGALSHVVSQLSSKQHSNDALPVVQLTIDIISWEFGTEAWDVGIPLNSKTVVRCPASWRDFLIRPDFCGAMFHIHESVVRSQPDLAHALRQLLLLLASLSGAIFLDQEQRKAFATYLLDGTLNLLSLSTSTDTQETSELLDSLTIMTRLIANFRLSLLVNLPSFTGLLAAITSTGTALLDANNQECESVQGDIESMVHREWREEAVATILEGCVLLSGDPWLLFSSTDDSRKAAQLALASTLAPLYNAFLTCRINMAGLEEHYLASNAADLDEDREEIAAVDLDEEMVSVASLGRLNLSTSLTCISSLFQPVLQNLQALWDMPLVTDVTPDNAALLEKTRLLIISLGHLLTDDNSGETPVIPETLLFCCQGDPNTTNGILASVEAIMALARRQAGKVATNSQNAALSPLLATTFLWFLNRWAPAYILPVEYGSTDGPPSLLVSVWTSHRASEAVAFCTTLCLHYQCYWPQERQVQDNSSKLLLQLSRRGQNLRSLIVRSQSFQQIATLHCLTARLSHSALPDELNAIVEANGNTISIEMVRGYQRLSYDDRAEVLTALLVGACDADAESGTSNVIFHECLGSVHNAFKNLVDCLAQKRVVATDLDAKEMASLCVAMYGGVARSSDIAEPERIVAFFTPVLQDLSGLMTFYSEDLSICEALLKLFRDYTAYFVVLLDKEQSLALFRASADLLRSYSAQHCASRVVTRPTASSAATAAEEEQKYGDVLCTIQLLINLGTKDFLDFCTTTGDGVDSGQITDVIFFGLQQILPLMTEGLLQYPTLCTQYFSLVGFMMDTYPDKVCILPYDLFNALLESLLFGMSHVDTFVAKSSLQGIAGIAKEHLQTRVLCQHLASHPDIFDRCVGRLLQEVVFQSIVWDRLEASGMALLPLAAVDVNRFVAVVNVLAQQVPAEQQARLHLAFGKLVQQDVLSKVSSGGYDGRMNRIKFKKNFEMFVKEIHSFVVIK